MLRNGVPRPAVIVHRERIYRMLDGDPAAAVWIHAPPGAGKTCAAAGYLASRNQSCRWLALSATHRDPAMFFSDLDRGEVHRDYAGLVALGGADQAFLPNYARGFFTEFFARVQPACLVLDDLHEAQDSAPLLVVRQVLLDLLPDGCRLFCLSRAALPHSLQDYWGRRRFTTLRYEHLRLTDPEAGQLVALHGRTCSSARVAAANRRVDGSPMFLAEIAMAGKLDSDAREVPAKLQVYLM